VLVGAKQVSASASARAGEEGQENGNGMVSYCLRASLIGPVKKGRE